MRWLSGPKVLSPLNKLIFYFRWLTRKWRWSYTLSRCVIESMNKLNPVHVLYSFIYSLCFRNRWQDFRTTLYIVFVQKGKPTEQFEQFYRTESYLPHTQAVQSEKSECLVIRKKLIVPLPYMIMFFSCLSHRISPLRPLPSKLLCH